MINSRVPNIILKFGTIPTLPSDFPHNNADKKKPIKYPLIGYINRSIISIITGMFNPYNQILAEALNNVLR
jgi:hypothetical protein